MSCGKYVQYNKLLAYTNTFTDTDIHAHIHRHTHTHTYKYTHTYKHTHTQRTQKHLQTEAIARNQASMILTLHYKLNKFYSFYMAAAVLMSSRHHQRIEVCHRNQPNMSKLALYKLLLSL